MGCNRTRPNKHSFAAGCVLTTGRAAKNFLRHNAYEPIITEAWKRVDPLHKPASQRDVDVDTRQARV